MFGDYFKSKVPAVRDIKIERLQFEDSFRIVTPGFTSPASRFESIEAALKAIKLIPSDRVNIVDVRSQRITIIANGKEDTLWTGEDGKVNRSVIQFTPPSKY